MIYICLFTAAFHADILLSCDAVAAALSDTKYQFLCPRDSLLGDGASATTYRVLMYNDKDAGPGRAFAGKVVSIATSFERQKFELEVETLREFKGNENVIQIYRNLQQSPYGFMLLELGTQGSLDKFIAKHPSLYKHPKLVLQMFLGLLKGVQSIHNKGFVHTDLKTLNVVVGDHSILKVIDFDMVRENGYSGGRQGTYLYMDVPQLLNSMEPYTPSTDIHALGIILYEMVHEGNRPYISSTVNSLIKKVVAGEYKMKDGTHWLIAYLIVKCLSTNQQHRLNIPKMIKLIEDQLPSVSSNLDPADGFPGQIIKSGTDYQPKEFIPKKKPKVDDVYVFTDKEGIKYTQEQFDQLMKFMDAEERRIERENKVLELKLVRLRLDQLGQQEQLLKLDSKGSGLLAGPNPRVSERLPAISSQKNLLVDKNSMPQKDYPRKADLAGDYKARRAEIAHKALQNGREFLDLINKKEKGQIQSSEFDKRMKQLDQKRVNFKDSPLEPIKKGKNQRRLAQGFDSSKALGGSQGSLPNLPTMVWFLISLGFMVLFSLKLLRMGLRSSAGRSTTQPLETRDLESVGRDSAVAIGEDNLGL